jgi:hypothetical protein
MWLRPRDCLGGKHAARSRPVLDDELLAVHLGETLRGDAGDAVAAATRREWNNDLDRLLRPVERMCGCEEVDGDSGEQCD